MFFVVNRPTISAFNGENRPLTLTFRCPQLIKGFTMRYGHLDSWWLPRPVNRDAAVAVFVVVVFVVVFVGQTFQMNDQMLVKSSKTLFVTERKLNNNYSMSPSWIRSDKITNERLARVGYNHFISNKGEWNNCFSKFSNRVLPPIFISTILQCGKFLNLAHYFPYDVKLRLLAHSRSFLANQKATNAIVGADNLLMSYIAPFLSCLLLCTTTFRTPDMTRKWLEMAWLERSYQCSQSFIILEPELSISRYVR